MSYKIGGPRLVADYSRQTILQRPSRFVTEVPPSLYDIWSLEEETNPRLPEDESRGFIN